MDSLVGDLISLGVPGTLLALTVWYTRRYDSINERTVRLLERDRNHWRKRALIAEARLSGAQWQEDEDTVP